MKVLKIVLKELFGFIIAMILVAIWGLLFSFPLMWSWNYVMPYLFKLPIINYWRMYLFYIILHGLWKLTIINIGGNK